MEEEGRVGRIRFSIGPRVGLYIGLEEWWKRGKKARERERERFVSVVGMLTLPFILERRSSPFPPLFLYFLPPVSTPPSSLHRFLCLFYPSVISVVSVRQTNCFVSLFSFFFCSYSPVLWVHFLLSALPSVFFFFLFFVWPLLAVFCSYYFVVYHFYSVFFFGLICLFVSLGEEKRASESWWW